MGAARTKSKTKKNKDKNVLKKKNIRSFLSLGLDKTIDVASGGRGGRENAARRRAYHALERRHDAVARGRDVAVAQRAEEAAALANRPRD